LTRPGNEAFILAYLHEVAEGWFPEECHSTGTDWKAIWRISCPLTIIPERSSQRIKKWLSSSVEKGAFISRNGVLAIFLLVNGREMTLQVTSQEFRENF